MRVYLLGWFCFFGTFNAALPAQAAGEGPVRTVVTTGNYAETDPLLTADGNILYFVRPRHPRNKGANNRSDVWLRHRQADGSWGRALNAGGPINSFSDDLPLGISADGRRLAILRRGAGNAHFDLLERGTRSWRIILTQELPEAIDASFRATFDPATNVLIYTAVMNGQSDLLRRKLTPAGWTEPEPLNWLNTPENETAPRLPPGGDELYFRRSGHWQLARFSADRAGFADDRSLSDALPAPYGAPSFCVGDQREVVVSERDDNTGLTRLVEVSLDPEARPAAQRILRGQVKARAGEAGPLGSVEMIVNQRARCLYPAPDGTYALVIPAGAAPPDLHVPGFLPTATTAARTEQTDQTARTPRTTNFSEAYYRRERAITDLYQRIDITTNEVAKLEAERKALAKDLRREQLAAGAEVLSGYIDPELVKLRARTLAARRNLGADTIPPAATTPTEKPTIRRTENASALDELDARQQRFRANQTARDGSQTDWRTTDPVAVRKSAARQLEQEVIPTISREIARGVYAESQIDSLAMEANIRSNLFATDRPAVYERESWENELIDNIQPTAKAALRERLREPVQRGAQRERELQLALRDRQDQLERYRDSLDQQLQAQILEERRTPRATTLAAPTPDVPAAPAAGRDLVAKGGTLALVPLAAGQRLRLQSLRFGPNSDIIRPGTTGELDRLAAQLRQHPDLHVEIGVHENANLSYTAADELSQKRANRIRDYLIDAGLAAERITPQGYGRQQPLADDATPYGRTQNQRVELRFR